MKQLRKCVYWGLPVIGVLFYLLYLHRSAIDMVYSDYIRLINSYLPDVWNPEKFFVPDLLTRIPVNYFERGLNVSLFGYSVTFDRVMGVLSFGLSAMILASYGKKYRIGLGWYAAMMVFMFSLNKWEMLYNGTGWAHFLAFAFFFWNYTVLDAVYGRHGGRHDKVLLFVLPAVTTVFVAGPYCAIYIMTLLLTYGFLFVKDRLILRDDRKKAEAQAPAGSASVGFIDRRLGLLSGKTLLGLSIAAVLPLFLYLWSNSMAVYEYSGAVDEPLLSAFLREPKFFLTFFLKSFSSMIFGVEWMSRHMSWLPGEALCLLGLFVIGVYFLAVWMNFYYGLYKKTLFPLMLLAGGGMNHLLVLASRWIFMPNDLYGMSSRYALQYEIGILGIFLTFGLVSRRKFKRRGKASVNPQVMRAIAVFTAAVFLLGNVVTTAEEFSHGVNRRIYNEGNREVLLDFENRSEDELKTVLEYHKDGVKEALTILKDNHWNIFKDTDEQEEIR